MYTSHEISFHLSTILICCWAFILYILLYFAVAACYSIRNSIQNVICCNILDLLIIKLFHLLYLYFMGSLIEEM